MAQRDEYTLTVTDTFGDDANYAWVRKFKFMATSARGAIHMLARQYDKGWRLNYDASDFARYDLKGAAVCCFVELSVYAEFREQEQADEAERAEQQRIAETPEGRAAEQAWHEEQVRVAQELWDAEQAEQDRKDDAAKAARAAKAAATE